VTGEITSLRDRSSVTLAGATFGDFKADQSRDHHGWQQLPEYRLTCGK